jgi:hypothetical protein
LKSRFFLFFLFFAVSVARTQAASDREDSELLGLPRLTGEAVISLITYTPGEELYQAFGHSCIRIRDEGLGFDRLYNFGTFDFDTPDFYLKFARGDLLYDLAVGQADAEINAVAAGGQGVTEVVLNFTQEQKQELFRNLEVNLLPENRAYRYDFIFDNCSTRVRDAFERICAQQLAAPTKKPRTFRQMLDPYLNRIPWTQFGIYLLLGMRVDRPVTGREACFLPADLESAVENGFVHGANLESDRVRVFEPKGLPQPILWLRPQFVFCIIGILWFLVWHFRKQIYSPRLSGVYLAIIGLAGTFVLVFSLVTRHWVAHENLNLIWLFPGHLVAGLWLIRLPDSSSPILRWYLTIACFGTALFAVLAPWLPQQFHIAIYPLIALVIWRCALARATRPANLPRR